MRTLRKNTQMLRYVLFEEDVPVYETDDAGNVIFDNIDGAEVARILEYRNGYRNVQTFAGNIGFAGGESEAEVFGISVDAYDSRLVLPNDKVPITETSLIFKESEPKYDTKGNLKKSSADFRVVKIARGLTDTVYLLKRIVHDAEV